MYLSFIKKLLRNFIRNNGKEVITTSLTFPTGKTRADLIKNLIQKLAPLKTEKPLVRVGPNGDGGYLVPNDLDSIYALFSPGVSTISGFEKDCALRGIKVFLADKSVDFPAEEDPNFIFTKKFVGCIDNCDYMTLESWIEASLPADFDGDLILQMDIEGAEYESILSIPNSLIKRFRIIIVEFHSLDQLWSRPFFNLASRVFAKLLQYHSCVHIHPNNCCGSLGYEGIEIPRVAEFTFLRKDRGILASHVSKFPHPLDVDNTSDPPLYLPKCWICKD